LSSCPVIAKLDTGETAREFTWLAPSAESLENFIRVGLPVSLSKIARKGEE
jgi:hypothetical protein